MREEDVTSDEFNYREDASEFLENKKDAISYGDYDDELDNPSSIGKVWQMMSESDKDFIREELNERKEYLSEEGRPDTLEELEN